MATQKEEGAQMESDAGFLFLLSLTPRRLILSSCLFFFSSCDLVFLALLVIKCHLHRGFCIHIDNKSTKFGQFIPLNKTYFNNRFSYPYSHVIFCLHLFSSINALGKWIQFAHIVTISFAPNSYMSITNSREVKIVVI